jgi:hypothetical protein
MVKAPNEGPMANKLTIYFSSKFIDFGRTLNSRNGNAPPGLGIPRNAGPVMAMRQQVWG